MQHNIQTKTTSETYQTLCTLLDKNSKVYFSRFGDGDVVLMWGQDQRSHRHSPELQQELLESFNIKHPQYLKGLGANQINEPGMKEGLFARFDYINADLCNWLHQTQGSNLIFESPIMFHYFSVFKPEYMVHFLRKYVWPKKKMFIGCLPKEDIEKCVGKVDYYVQVPDTNAYHSIDEWWPKVLQDIDKVDLCLPAAGMAGRIIQKRLWKLNKNLHSIDLGSIVDAVAERDTRTWIKMTKNEIPNFMIKLQNDIRPTIGIAMTCYNKFNYTAQALESLHESIKHSPYKYEIGLFDDASTEDLSGLVDLFPGLRYYKNSHNKGITSLWNEAYRMFKDKDYLILSNNDVKFSSGWADELISNMIQEKAAAGGPLTNSPGHAKKFGADFSHFVPNGHLFNEDLEKVSSEVRGKKAVRMPMLNGFCYAIHNSTINKHRHSDTNLFNEDKFPIWGSEDNFFANLRLNNEKMILVPSSYVFHYKGISYTEKLHYVDQRARSTSPLVVTLKRKRIGIMGSYWAYPPVNENTLETKFYGGSEKYLIEFAKELANYHDVDVYTKTEGAEFLYEGVNFLDYKMFNYDLPYDLVIGYRDFDMFVKRPNAIITAFFSRDASVFIEPEDHALYKELVNYRKNIDYCFMSSKYHKELIQKEIPFVTDEQTLIIPNGIRSKEIKTPLKSNEKRNIILVGSDPKRVALDFKRLILQIRERVPDAELWLTHDYSERHEGINDIEGVKHLGSLPKDDFIDAIKQSKIVLCPTWHESFNNIAVEAQAHGTPVVGNYVTAMKETISPKAGYFIPFEFLDDDKEFIDAYSYKIIKILLSDDLHDQFSKAGQEFVLRNFEFNNVVNNFLMWLESK